MTEFYEIDSLVKLFNPPRDEEDSDSDYDTCENSQPQCNVDKRLKEPKPNPYTQIEPAEIERKVFDDYESEIPNASEADYSDWKKTPKWSISYRQNVYASDVFLQMGGKTPATASCENMVVSIDLPGEHMQNMDIKVQTNSLEVHSPNFSLKIPLPQPVHPQKGDAKWDKEQGRLTITLTMEREFDFINF